MQHNLKIFPRSYLLEPHCSQFHQILTLSVKLADDGVDEGVLGGDMAPPDGHGRAAAGAGELPLGRRKVLLNY